MKKIELTQGQFALVDDEDFEYLNQWKWYVAKGKYTNYAQRMDRSSGKRKTVRMSRVILKTKTGFVSDHKDGNGLNNQKSNLRNCTRHENAMNKRIANRGKTSIYRGVSWYSRYKKWKACILSGKDRKHIGYFDNEIEAAKAYDKKAISCFGEFLGELNFPLTDYIHGIK
jgi:hypothetical protein